MEELKVKTTVMDDRRNYLQNENTNHVSDKKVIDEVLRIKHVLDSNGDKSEAILCDLLIKLRSFVVSVKILEATGVGKSVSSLKNHTSIKVKNVARIIINEWKRMVDEWVDAIEKKEEKGGDRVSKRNIIKVPLKLIDRFKNNSKTESADLKCPVTPEQIVTSNEKADTTRVSRQGVAEVLRLKKILEIRNRDEEVSSVVCESLVKLEYMRLTLKMLEETGIGITVRALEKHKSKDVCEIARRLVKGWKSMVDERLRKESKVITETKLRINSEISDSQNQSVVVTPYEQSLEMYLEAKIIDQQIFEATKKELQQIKLEKGKVAKLQPKKGLNSRSTFVKKQMNVVNTGTKKLQTDSEKSNSQRSVVVLAIPHQQSKQMYSKAKITEHKPEASKRKLPQPKINSRIEKGKATKLQTRKRIKGRSIFVMEKKSLPVVKKQQSVVLKPNKVPVSMESKLQSPPKSIGQPKSQVPFQRVEPKTIDKRSFEEKVIATKRKLQDDYEKARNMKKRRVQMMEVYDVLGQGLAPKFENDRSCMRINRCIGLVH